jgi:hypothetical protein
MILMQIHIVSVEPHQALRATRNAANTGKLADMFLREEPMVESQLADMSPSLGYTPAYYSRGLGLRIQTFEVGICHRDWFHYFNMGRPNIS